jgi:hypothetical protein
LINTSEWWALRYRARRGRPGRGNAPREATAEHGVAGPRHHPQAASAPPAAEPPAAEPPAAEPLDLELRLTRFPHLDVAIMDGFVYTTTRGLSPLGPLATATALSRRLPARLESAQPGHSYPGTAPAREIQRTAVAVVSGQSSHQLVIDHNATSFTVRQVESQVAQFNVLAGAARS